MYALPFFYLLNQRDVLLVILTILWLSVLSLSQVLICYNACEIRIFEKSHTALINKNYIWATSFSIDF